MWDRTTQGLKADGCQIDYGKAGACTPTSHASPPHVPHSGMLSHDGRHWMLLMRLSALRRGGSAHIPRRPARDGNSDSTQTTGTSGTRSDQTHTTG